MAYTYTSSVNSKGNSAIQFRMGYEIASQNTGATPSSVVNVVLQTRRTNTSTTNKQPASTTMTINTTSYTQATNYNVSGYTQNTWYTIMTKSGITVLHDPATGEKTLPLAFSINLSGTSASSASGEWSVTLTPIPMGSTLTLNAASYTIGSSNPTVTATITGHNTSYYHQLLFYIDGNSTAIVTKNVGVVSSSTMQVTATQSLVAGTWLPLIPNSVTGNCTCILRTYTTSGRTVQVGVDSVVNFTIVCGQYPTLGAVSVAPVCTTNNWASGKSSAKITAASASGIQSSTISTYEFLQNGAVIKTYSSGSLPSGWTIDQTGWTTASALNAGSYTFGVRITDSRGLSTTKSASAITVPAYSQPSISNISIFRSNGSGTQTSDGTFIYVKATATAITTGNNITSFKCYIKPSTDPSWGSAKTPFSSGTASEFSGYSTTVSYNVKLEATDAFGSVSTYTTTVQTAAFTMDFKVGGLGIGVGKAAEEDNLLDSAWDIKSAGNIQATEQFRGKPTASAGGSYVGKIIIPPKYRYDDLELSSGNNLAFWTAWMKKVCSIYSGIAYGVYITSAQPDSAGTVIWHCYTTAGLTDGLPTSSSGIYIPYGNSSTKLFRFGTTSATAWFSSQDLVSGTDQSFSGVKRLATQSGMYGNNAGVRFYPDATNANYATISAWQKVVNSKRVMERFYFTEFSHDSTTGDMLSYYEDYRLPAVTANKTAGSTYDILTSKSKVTIAQGGTGHGTPAAVTSDVVTRTSGATVTEQSFIKFGKVAFLYMKLTYSTQVTSNNNLFVGTIASGYRPSQMGGGGGYYSGGNVQVNIATDGTITVRVCGGTAITASNGMGIMCQYFLA